MPKRLNILIADDDYDDHFFFEEAIRQSGIENYNILAFYNGRQMIDYLLMVNSDDLMPDMIVLDLNMPVLDGFSVLNKIKASEHFKNIPVYILTTSNSNEHRDACISAGCAGYYMKPVKLSQLKEIVEEMLLSVRSS